jgi:hypothetical protein
VNFGVLAIVLAFTVGIYPSATENSRAAQPQLLSLPKKVEQTDARQFGASPTNHWLTLRLIGTTSNRDAIGAKVRIKATIRGKTVWQLREVSSSGRDDMRPHFGLGDATNVEVIRIEWPSGKVQEFDNAPSDRLLTITEEVGSTRLR